MSCIFIETLILRVLILMIIQFLYPGRVFFIKNYKRFYSEEKILFKIIDIMLL